MATNIPIRLNMHEMSRCGMCYERPQRLAEATEAQMTNLIYSRRAIKLSSPFIYQRKASASDGVMGYQCCSAIDVEIGQLLMRSR